MLKFLSSLEMTIVTLGLTVFLLTMMEGKRRELEVLEVCETFCTEMGSEVESYDAVSCQCTAVTDSRDSNAGPRTSRSEAK